MERYYARIGALSPAETKKLRDDILAIQTRLQTAAAIGYPGAVKPPADGFLGDQTVLAIRAFRRAAGLPDITTTDATFEAALINFIRARGFPAPTPSTPAEAVFQALKRASLLAGDATLSQRILAEATAITKGQAPNTTTLFLLSGEARGRGAVETANILTDIARGVPGVTTAALPQPSGGETFSSASPEGGSGAGQKSMVKDILTFAVLTSPAWGTLLLSRFL